jgi:hypothetical protein
VPRKYGNAGAPFAFGIGGGFTWNDDPGYALVGKQRQGHFETFASYDVLQLAPRLVVSLGASLRRRRADGDLLEITDHLIQGDLLARFALASWLWPQLRASFGAAITQVRLKDAGGAIEDRDVAPASTFGGGIIVRTPTRAFESQRGKLASLSFGLLTEAGYTLGRAASIQGTPSGGSSDVERSAVRLGKLNRSVPYLRLAGVVRF